MDSFSIEMEKITFRESEQPLLHTKLTGVELSLGKMSVWQFLLKRKSDPWLSTLFLLFSCLFFHYWWSIYDLLKLSSDYIGKEYCTLVGFILQE